MRFDIKGIEPMGAVRTTQKQKFVDPSAKKYMQYKKDIYNSILEKLNGVYDPLDAAVAVMVKFKMPIPASWPKAKREEAANGMMHTKKPDLDNLVKGLFDAVNGLCWVDDNRVSSVIASKEYSDEPGIDITIVPIGGLSHGQAKAKEETKQRGKRKAESRTRRNIRKRV